MAIEKEQFQNIERLEIMEEKFGVTIEGLNAEMCYYNGTDILPTLTIYGEIHSVNGANINEDFYIICAAFNKEGKIIGKTDKHMCKDSFFVFQLFEININDLSAKPAKIRIYPNPNY